MQMMMICNTTLHVSCDAALHHMDLHPIIIIISLKFTYWFNIFTVDDEATRTIRCIGLGRTGKCTSYQEEHQSHVHSEELVDSHNN